MTKRNYSTTRNKTGGFTWKKIPDGEIRRLNGLKIDARISSNMIGRLNEWEREFLRSTINQSFRLTSKQIEILNKIHHKYNPGSKKKY